MIDRINIFIQKYNSLISLKLSLFKPSRNLYWMPENLVIKGPLSALHFVQNHYQGLPKFQRKGQFIWLSNDKLLLFCHKCSFLKDPSSFYKHSDISKYVCSGIQFDHKITRSFNMVLLGGINNFNRYIIKYILKIDILWIDISSIEVIDSTK